MAETAQRWNACRFAMTRHLAKRLKAYRRPLRHQGFEKMRIGRPTFGALLFWELVKDLKVSKPTTKTLALVFLWSCFLLHLSLYRTFWVESILKHGFHGGCASAEARHWALWVALVALLVCHDCMILQSLNGLRYGVPKAFVFVELPTPITTSILVWNLGLGIGQNLQLVALIGRRNYSVFDMICWMKNPASGWGRCNIVTSCPIPFTHLLPYFKDLN